MLREAEERLEHMALLVRILLIWLLCLLSVFLHELGHAIGYRISTGKVNWKVIAGSGPRILGTSRYTFCLIPAGGYFIPREEAGTDKAKIITLAAGPCVSLVQAILYGIIQFCIKEFVLCGSSLYEILIPVSAFLLYFNFFQFLFTVIPIRYRIICRGHESDGLQIIHVMRKS